MTGQWKMAIASLTVTVVGGLALFAALNMKARTPDWTGFYYRDVAGRTEPLSLILKNPSARSQAGAFRTIEACQDWAEFVRLKEGALATGREDLFYCARNCRVVEGSGADCGDSQANVFLFSEE